MTDQNTMDALSESESKRSFGASKTPKIRSRNKKDIGMDLRLTIADVPIKVSIEEFKELIRAGKVGPKTLYREFWTNGDWRTVDTLPLFRRMTAPEYSYENELAQEREFVARRKREAEAAALVRPLIEARDSEYETGDLIERCYRVGSLSEMVSEPGTLGAARFFLLPSFEPEVIFTFLFKPLFFHVEGVAGETSIWNHLSETKTYTYRTGDQEAIRDFSYPSKVTRVESQLTYGDAPKPFSSWAEFTDVAMQLKSCQTPLVLDGRSYLQRVLYRGEVHTVKWSNPDDSSCPKQTEMVKSYFDCLIAAKLFDSFVPKEF